jgi:chorismate dehydratase
MTRPLRISAISFLNTAPLMWDFEHDPSPELVQNFRVDYTVPSMCAKQLKEGSADIGIVPVITTATIPGLVIVPDVSISAKGPVKSILLVSKVPIESVKIVAADTSSRTSVALTQVLFTKFFGGPRELVPMDPDLATMLSACNAALLIGDSALVAKTSGYHVYDLAEVWKEKTGKAFVFAVWAVRKAALLEADSKLDIPSIFQHSRDHGLEPENLLGISRDWAPKLEMTVADVQSYLRDNIFYKLDQQCLDGLRLYFQYAEECGLIAPSSNFEMLGSATGTSAR